jgi:hypothetical protein
MFGIWLEKFQFALSPSLVAASICWGMFISRYELSRFFRSDDTD